jgi:hypothetical protein
MVKCIKCNKNFKSEYLLNKHINRKYPCDIIFNCEKCNSIFKDKRTLDLHLNRKTLCTKKIIKPEAEIILEIEKLKLYKKEKEYQHEKEMLELKKENEVAKLEILNKIKLQGKEKFWQHEKEIIELKKQAALEKISLSEKLKTERKEKTVTHINNIHIENKIQNTIQNNIKLEQNFIQHVTNLYGENPNVISIEDATSNLVTLMEKNPFLTMEIYDSFNSDDDLIVKLLERIYSNPNTKQIVYQDELDAYYIVLLVDDKLKIKKVNFVNDIDSKLKDALKSLLDALYRCSLYASPKTRRGFGPDFNRRSIVISTMEKTIDEIDIQPMSAKAFAIESV